MSKLSKTVTAEFGPDYKKVKVGDVVTLAENKPLRLDCGQEVSSFPMAYQAYGELNKDKSNAILVCHGLTGDQYLLGEHPVTGKPGWWEDIVGSGKILDTDKYFIICANVIGGCMGSWGPKSINPKTNKPYNMDFPVVTIGDMVRAQKLLIEYFEIEQLFAVVGGSMGGLLALEWAAKYPECVYAAVPIATAARHTAQNIAFHEIGRQAIKADPAWHGGNYIEHRSLPSKGLAVGRMMAHVTYMSESGLARKFGRGLQDKEAITYAFDTDFQVESYLLHQGQSFVNRFDPNSYLYVTKAMDYFDLDADYGGMLANAFKNTQTRFCVISFSSDWLFPTSEAKHIVHALNASVARVSFVEVVTDRGHDAFLLKEPEFWKTLDGFIKGIAESRGF
jgi:homoserine O-acetyltransferase/O-succinyltransferase